MSDAQLTGPQKAALVILFLEQDLAGQVLANLDDVELRALAAAVDSMDPVPHEALPSTLEEFERALREPVLMGHSGRYMRRLATATFGSERASDLFFEAPANRGQGAGPGTPFEQIRAARPATVAELLAEEHPQVAAVIMSQLTSDQASAVLQEWDEELQVDMIRRIAQLEEVPRAVLETASASMVEALIEAGAIGSDSAAAEFAGLEFAASLVNNLPPEVAETLLEELGDMSEEMSQKIREAMFTFEDLGRLANRELQHLMREISSDDLAIALRTAAESLREAFFGAMSSRAAQTLREDLEIMPPRRLSEVEAAQRAIVEIAMQMAGEGRLQMPGNAGEEMV